jgi:hypothetical protein
MEEKQSAANGILESAIIFIWELKIKSLKLKAKVQGSKLNKF